MLKNKLFAKGYIVWAMMCALMLSACDMGENDNVQQGSDVEVVLKDENQEEPDTDEDDDEEEDDVLQKPAEELRIDVRAVVVGDCTGIGMAPIMGWGEKDKNHEKYTLTVKTTADEAAQELRGGNADIAILPLTKAIEMYSENKDVVVLATNTFNNIYIATLDSNITEKSNLSGQTIAYCSDNSLTAGVAQKIIASCGATAQAVDSNETIRAGLVDGSIQLAVVPEPYITLAKMDNDNVEMGPDVAAIWSESNECDIISSVLVARSDFIDRNRDSIEYIVDDFRQSVNTVIHGVPKTLDWSAEFNIVTDKSLAVSSMKNCNYTFMSGGEMRGAIKKFLRTNKDVISEDMTDNGFYFAD